VPGLIDGEFGAVWQADRGEQPPALIRDVPCRFDSIAPQLSEGGMDVVAHQVELVAALAVGRVNRKLGRGQGENEPAAACVY
jgi:hypothetical protein